MRDWLDAGVQQGGVVFDKAKTVVYYAWVPLVVVAGARACGLTWRDARDALTPLF